MSDLDEVAPTITSGVTATAIDENSGPSQVVYIATADDTLDISAGVSFSLTEDSDPALSINASTGAVTLAGKPDHEDQASYSFTVLATDGVNTPVAQMVTLAINDLDEVAPTLTSSTPADNATAVAVGNNIVLTFDENVQAGSGDIVISNGTDTRTISVTDNQVTISGDKVTINPTEDLQEGSIYNVQIAKGVIKDIAGNDYAGILDATTLDFATAPPWVRFSLEELAMIL